MTPTRPRFPPFSHSIGNIDGVEDLMGRGQLAERIAHDLLSIELDRLPVAVAV